MLVILFNYVHKCFVWVCTYEYMCLKSSEVGVGFPVARDSGCCEPINVGSGNCKSSIYIS